MAEEETRRICIASGKGGVGKTVIALNLGLALGKSGKDVILLDADLDMANLEVVLDMQGRPITLQDVMKEEADIEDAIYSIEGQEARVVPAGISPNEFRRMDPDKFERVMDDLSKECDIILVDAPAGIGKDTISCFNACQETLLVATPETISAIDASKAKTVSEKMGSPVKGVVMNRVPEKRYGMNNKEITALLNTPVISEIKEDPKIRKAVEEKKPVIDYYPEHQFTKEIKDLTQQLIGKAYKKKKKKTGILSKLKGIFKR